MAQPRPTVAQSQYELLAALRHALAGFLHFSRQAAVAAGLTPRQHQALLAIKGFSGGGPMSVGDLAGRLHLRHHSVVGLVDRLVKLQLVRRVPSLADRRRVEVRLTARGESHLRRLSAVHLQELRQLAPGLHRLLGSITRS